MDTIIRPIWKKKAVKMSGFNLFTKTNLQVFDVNGEVRVLLGVNITRDAEAANILLPFGAGVEAQVYVFFQSVEFGIYSIDQHGLVNVI